MSKLTVTIIDVLGMLVPGVVMLFGFIFAPVPNSWLESLNGDLLKRMPLFANAWVGGGCCLAAAYVLGFILRLTSIPLMNRLTWRRWKPRLEREAGALAPALKHAIADNRLSKILVGLARDYGSADPGTYAPYFHFAKRLLRPHPELWVEAERLEAEVRFTAGLFVPMIVLAIDGAYRAFFDPSGWLLLLIGAAGATLVLRTYPSRRVKEILYNQYLALVALRQG